MTSLLQFTGVECENTSVRTFSMDAGELRVLRVASKDEKALVMELALGEKKPDFGLITLLGGLLDEAPPGSLGWVPALGGLISNLKTWENVTLPLWYHGKHSSAIAEERVRRWLAVLGMDSEEWENFMASPSGKLRTVERKLAGLLRGLVQSPLLLVIDAMLFDGLEPAMRDAWVAALEQWVIESKGAVLVVSEKETALPWGLIG